MAAQAGGAALPPGPWGSRPRAGRGWGITEHLGSVGLQAGRLDRTPAWTAHVGKQREATAPEAPGPVGTGF